MVFKEYLADQGIKLSDLAALAAFGKRLTPEVSGHAVRKWARGERQPRLEVVEQIEEITNGAVTLRDFTAQGKAA